LHHIQRTLGTLPARGRPWRRNTRQRDLIHPRSCESSEYEPTWAFIAWRETACIANPQSRRL
jgi:hypothetical protein